jgi:hypothetical protein
VTSPTILPFYSTRFSVVLFQLKQLELQIKAGVAIKEIAVQDLQSLEMQIREVITEQRRRNALFVDAQEAEDGKPPLHRHAVFRWKLSDCHSATLTFFETCFVTPLPPALSNKGAMNNRPGSGNRQWQGR